MRSSVLFWILLALFLFWGGVRGQEAKEKQPPPDKGEATTEGLDAVNLKGNEGLWSDKESLWKSTGLSREAFRRELVLKGISATEIARVLKIADGPCITGRPIPLELLITATELLLRKPYSTDDGLLKTELTLRDRQEGFAGETGTLVVIRPHGDWTERRFGPKEGQSDPPHRLGTLSRRTVRKLIEALAQASFLKLPEEIGKPAPVNPHTMTITVGEKRVSLHLPLGGKIQEVEAPEDKAERAAWQSFRNLLLGVERAVNTQPTSYFIQWEEPLALEEIPERLLPLLCHGVERLDPNRRDLYLVSFDGTAPTEHLEAFLSRMRGVKHAEFNARFIKE